ncbi:MAG: hypothetical protein RL754_412 [Bacteroidota bacterium]|jgi:multidrug efflux pump subunit AcrA (membrane-fusion protein)
MNIKWVRNAIIAVAILFVGVMISKRLRGMATKAEIISDKAVPSVKVNAVELDTVMLPLNVYGKINATERVDLLAEVSGSFKSSDRNFLEGTRFSKGQTLIGLDDSEARANVMSLKGNFINSLLGILPDIKTDYPEHYDAFETYYNETGLSKPLAALPEATGKLEKFLIARGIQSAFYQVKSAEERLEKFSITAPFDGVVASALIKPGNLVSPGRALGTFVGFGSYELKSAVTLAYADRLSIGQEVVFTSPDVAGNWTGKIARISPVVDAASQSVQLVINISGNGLREGMYLTGTIQGLEVQNAIKVPAYMVFDNGFVFTVAQDSVLQKTPVRVVEWLDNEIIIEGLNTGQFIVDEPTFKGTSGMIVRALANQK